MNKRMISTLLFLIVLTVLEWLFVHPHHGEGSSMFDFKGFYVLLGFLGAIVFMTGAKALGKIFLYRKEDYYEL